MPKPRGARICRRGSAPRWTPENRPSIDTSKPATTGRGDRDLQLIESLSSGLPFFSLSPKRVLAVRMWESRVLCEISKALWKPFLWFPWGCHLHSHLRHRPRSSRSGGCCTLAGVPIVVPRGSVVLDRRTGPTAQRQSSIHVATRDTWFYVVASSARKSITSPPPGLALSSPMAAATSLERTVVFAHRGPVRVVDATYLGREFKAAAMGLMPGSATAPQE